MWTQGCAEATYTLKEYLTREPVLVIPDASDRGLEAVLNQMDNEGNECAISFLNKRLLLCEQSYSTVEN